MAGLVGTRLSFQCFAGEMRCASQLQRISPSPLKFSVEVLWEVETIGNIEVSFLKKRGLLRKSRFFSRLLFV
jgi:hypothetical protein